MATAMRDAWETLHQTGAASPKVAHLLKIGLTPFLGQFADYFLGPDGIGKGFKLVLGMNGEGKTHLLYCLRELALEQGHAVAFLEPKTGGSGDSPMDFARAILREIEPPEALDDDGDGELKLLRLLRVAVDRKRAALVAKGLEPDKLLARWADGLRNRDLHPHGLAAALADGVDAARREDAEALREAVARVSFVEAKLTKKQAEIDGALFVRAIPLIVSLLDFRPLVVLVDEAETAVEKKGSARRREFLKFLRFLNDHVAHNTAERSSAIVVIACTDDFWPEQFNEYDALKQRLADPGHDSLEDRGGLTTKALVRSNKLWVRETFGGDENDYQQLGEAIVDLAAAVYGELERDTQLSNARRFARVASSKKIRRQVKRYFVKALAQTIERQVADSNQRVIEERDALKAFDAAAQEIAEAAEE